MKCTKTRSVIHQSLSLELSPYPGKEGEIRLIVRSETAMGRKPKAHKLRIKGKRSQG